MTTKTGTLYGIGVGPGDPELITLKALKVLQSVPHIFASCSTKNTYSLALSIVRCHLNGAGIEHLAFPMTKDPEVLASAWERNARRVLEVLATGSDAAFVTLGDPLTYSTFGYLLKTLKRLNPELGIVTIPGITSYSAAAALTQIPLTEGEESFYLVSGALGAAQLKEVIDKSDNIVILKTYRYFDEIYQVLEDMDLLDRTTCISRCGLEGETIVENLRDIKGRELPYLSMVIIKKKGKGY
ncbi:MAG: precorrin-2 C(20)-methyltransferase [Proteobacteria bacterium]|nr:precorrin-2 C(20)-methyltransferase [Pseudomonadota bacterium]MBU4354426.1 precorrin-2 C(20)-methyltransferase [Pseudomonadota bacterium]MBU4447730.1 precorrin-2 C(20)-methyltransferase [Pseudomonadota bacterium]MCG2771917.1 precorrin-2 C(20)-methyltransferase [Desulfobacterales bacterium]